MNPQKRKHDDDDDDQYFTPLYRPTPTFYAALKTRGFVIYPGKVSIADCFRIGTIGEVYADDVRTLLVAVAETVHLQPRRGPWTVNQ